MKRPKYDGGMGAAGGMVGYPHPYAPPPPGGMGGPPKRPYNHMMGGNPQYSGHMNPPGGYGYGPPHPSNYQHQGGGGGGGGGVRPPLFNDLNDVARNRLNEDDRRKDPAFHGYQTGEPSKRLYVKNIGRMTTEDELRSLFRLFSEDGNSRYSLKYFTSGKMRYQCFVEYETMEAALSALVHTNGVLIHDKPICVSFGKSR